MRLEVDIPEHHYNNIMDLDSVSLGRVPYKAIIMYAINAIKHGKVLEQEPFINKPCVSSEVCEHDKNKVLDKIRAEIEQLPTTLIDVQRPHSVVERDVVELGSVIRIFDKYKAESEET